MVIKSFGAKTDRSVATVPLLTDRPWDEPMYKNCLPSANSQLPTTYRWVNVSFCCSCFESAMSDKIEAQEAPGPSAGQRRSRRGLRNPIRQHLDEIKRMYANGYSYTQIADALCKNHNLSPNVCHRTNVNSLIAYEITKGRMSNRRREGDENIATDAECRPPQRKRNRSNSK